MPVTLSGIITLVSVVQFLNAELPMLVTDRPLQESVSGIDTSPPGPLYLVMVTLLPLTV